MTLEKQTMGPLTTPFVEPIWCTSVIRSFRNVYQQRGGTCGPNGGFTRASEGYPTGSPISFTDSALLYSPAIACPVDWKSVGPSGTPTGTRTVTCCPSGYSAEGDSCWITKRLGLLSVYSCSGSVPVAVEYDDSVYPTKGPTSAYAKQVRLVLPSSDAFTTFTVTSNGGASPEPRTKLTGGAIFGMVTGILVLLLLLFVGAFTFMRRRKERQRTDHTIKSASNNGNTLPQSAKEGADVVKHQSRTPAQQ